MQAKEEDSPLGEALVPLRWWDSVVTAESSRLMQAPTGWLLKKAGMAGACIAHFLYSPQSARFLALSVPSIVGP